MRPAPPPDDWDAFVRTLQAWAAEKPDCRFWHGETSGWSADEVTARILVEIGLPAEAAGALVAVEAVAAARLMSFLPRGSLCYDRSCWHEEEVALLLPVCTRLMACGLLLSNSLHPDLREAAPEAGGRVGANGPALWSKEYTAFLGDSIMDCGIVGVGSGRGSAIWWEEDD